MEIDATGAIKLNLNSEEAHLLLIALRPDYYELNECRTQEVIKFREELKEKLIKILTHK